MPELTGKDVAVKAKEILAELKSEASILPSRNSGENDENYTERMANAVLEKLTQVAVIHAKLRGFFDGVLLGGD